MYNSYGSLSKNNLKEDYNFKNEKLNTVFDTNFTSPYNQPEYVYGNGPQLYNKIGVKNDPTYIPNIREPSGNNPFMNVMPLDYDAEQNYDNYDTYIKSYPSKKSLETKNKIKTEFEKGLYQDADSLLWNRLNSQRQYISMPVGSVPNNQPEFANWLYSVDNNCKMGSIFQNYGVKYTDDSLMCNGFNAAEPTNKGLLNGNLMSSVFKNN